MWWFVALGLFIVFIMIVSPSREMSPIEIDEIIDRQIKEDLEKERKKKLKP